MFQLFFAHLLAVDSGDAADDSDATANWNESAAGPFGILPAAHGAVYLYLEFH